MNDGYDMGQASEHTAYDQFSYSYGPPPSQTPKPAPHMVPDLSITEWLLVKFLLWIPIVGLVAMVIWATGNAVTGRESLINFSRASLIWMFIETVFTVFIYGAFLLLFAAAV